MRVTNSSEKIWQLKKTIQQLTKPIQQLKKTHAAATKKTMRAAILRHTDGMFWAYWALSSPGSFRMLSRYWSMSHGDKKSVPSNNQCILSTVITVISCDTVVHCLSSSSFLLRLLLILLYTLSHFMSICLFLAFLFQTNCCPLPISQRCFGDHIRFWQQYVILLA